MIVLLIAEESLFCYLWICRYPYTSSYIFILAVQLWNRDVVAALDMVCILVCLAFKLARSAALSRRSQAEQIEEDVDREAEEQDPCLLTFGQTEPALQPGELLVLTSRLSRHEA